MLNLLEYQKAECMHSLRLIRTTTLFLITGLMLVLTPSLSADEKADAFEPNAQKQEKANPPLNQLKQILQGLFGKGKPAAGQAAKDSKNARSPDYYRYPQDLEQERRFKSVQQLIEDQQWEAAREKLQVMLENSINLPVHLTEERGLITDRELIYELLELLPEAQQEKFDRQYTALAEKLLNDAQENEASPEQFAEIATRFSSTPAGARAMNFLISYHMERREFGLAEQYIQRLLKHRPALTESPQWKTKAAYILKQTGNKALTAELLHSQSNTRDLSQPIQIGGTTEKPLTWLEKQQILKNPSDQLQDEWPMLFGSPSHSARAQQADPLLIPRWSYPLTSNHSIQKQLNLIEEDLTSLNQATIPALPPLAVNGKVVLRTLKGVQVLDAKTGKPLWHSALENSPEESFIKAQLKGQDLPQARGLFDPAPATRSFSLYNGTNPDAHALTSLMYRNANWGSQSSDGKHLFILESMRLNLGASGSSRNLNRFRRNRGDFEEEFWSSNQLVAYDLETGQPKWKVGGTEFDEPFDLPLAGTFFFGAPTPAGDELYIIGERDREIRVYALDPETGAERWSQQIGNPDQDIAMDMVRRWWIAPVAVDQGGLICPRTIGLLTAIGQLNHSILWSTRYTNNSSKETRQQFNRISQTPFEALNQRWSPSAPIIVQNKVVYTPPEEEVLVCLDLITGIPVWTKRAKEAMLYVAGVTENQILMVGLSGVTAISLNTGKTSWHTPLPKEAGVPSGQAVIADQRLHVPLHSGQVWTFDATSGKVINKLYNANASQPLGNLIVHDGQFLSLGVNGLVSYEQKQTFEIEIEKLKQQSPHSPLALYKESELLMMSQEYQQALTKLQQIDRSQLPVTYQEKFHTLLIHCLSEIIRSDFQQHDNLVADLKQQVRSESERLELQRLLIERSRARKDFTLTLKRLQELGQGPQDTFFQNGSTETQIDCWIAGQAEDLWNQSRPEQKQQFAEYVDRRARELVQAAQPVQERFLSQFGFHPASIPVLRQLISHAQQSERFFEAELWLTRLMKQKQPELAAEGLAGMVRLCLKFELFEDAEYYLNQLSNFDQQLTLPDQQSLQQFREQQAQTVRELTAQKTQAGWNPEKLKLIVGGSARYYSAREQTLNTSKSSLPFYRTRNLIVNPRENRMMVTEPQQNSVLWSTPLRSIKQSRSSSFNESELVGHNLILQHRDMLHLYDLVDRQLIWSQKLEIQQANRYYSSLYHLRPAQLGSESTLVHRHHPSIAIRNVGMIAAANSDYTCFYSRRKIILVDTQTGKVRWKHENVDKETRVLGDDQMVYLVTRDRTIRKVLRVSDGQQVPQTNMIRLLHNAIYQGESSFVAISSASDKKLPGQATDKTSVFSFEPGSTELNWNLDFPGDSEFGLFNQHFLSVLTPQGEITVVDLRTGTPSRLEVIPRKELDKHKDFYLVADDVNFYFAAHTQAHNSISVNVPSVPTNGELYVFNRQTGKRIWNQSFEKKHLVLNEQNLLPVVLLVSREYKRVGNRSTSIIHLEALNKQTGKNLLKWEAPIDSNIRSIDVDYQQKIIEILTYNARIRLYDADELVMRQTHLQPAPNSKPAPANQ